MKKKYLFFLVLNFSFFNFLEAQTWTGTVSTSWNTAGNWSTNAVPTTSGSVIIPVPGIITNWPVLPGNITIGRLTMNAGSQLNTNGFNFIFTSTSGFTLTGATITNAVAANTSDFNIPGGTSSINGCTFNGNFSFFQTAGSFDEASSAANTWNSNVTFNLGANAALALSRSFASSFNGNLTANRADASGTMDFFWVGGLVTGNLSVSNPYGGLLRFGSLTKDIRILGTLNVVYGTGGSGYMYGVKNKTVGGSITLPSITSSGFAIKNDSLLVSALSLANTAGQISLDSNYITGTVTISAVNSTTYLDDNTFTEDVNFTGISNTYEAYTKPNHYLGNATFNGTQNISYGDTSFFYKNLTLNRATATTTGTFTGARFVGIDNSVFTQLGAGNIVVGRLIMEKTGTGKLTLASPLTVGTQARFAGGNIYTTASAPLKFANTISWTGASAASHVVGTVEKLGVSGSSAPFTFPVGSEVSYNPIAMSNPSAATDVFSAEYILQNPSSNGYNTNNKAGTLNNISKAGYWNFQRLAGTSNVTLTLGFSTNAYEQYPVLANLKVAYWNGSQWDDKGNGGTTGDATNGTLKNSTALTSYGPFALANVLPTYFYNYSNPGTGPDGTPVKIKAVGGYSFYFTKQLPAGTYTADSIYLVPNGSAASFKLKDFYGVEKDDTTITAPAAPTNYITANGSGTVNFSGWRNFVYMTDASNNIMGAIKDNGLTLGNVAMNTYFSTANVATSPNGNIFLKRSFKITAQLNPAGTKRVRFYITKTEFNNLVAADPASFPNGINSLTITKYSGPTEDSLFNPIPGGNAVIIPNSAITIADLGTMYSLDIDVTGFSGFYIGGNNSNLNICTGSSITLPSNIAGATYQWQADNGSGFVNINDGGAYSGTNTSSLTITNSPGILYGYKFRAVVNGGTLSQEYIIKFNASWQGTVSNVWENPANWSCGQLPDINTDVIVNAGKSNYPVLNSNASVRSMVVKSGTSVTVGTGFTLTILK